MVAWPNLSPNESSNATWHEADVVRQEVGLAPQVEISPTATWAETWGRILYSDFYRKTYGSMFMRILRNPLDDLAGPDIDPVSLVVPVCRLVDLRELRKRRAVPAN